MICCLEWLGRLKCLATGLDAFLPSFSASRKVFSENHSPRRYPLSPMYNFLQRVQVMQWMILAEVQVKWSVILMDRLGPEFSQLRIVKSHVFHLALVRLKVPGWSLVWNALLTRKLPMFLSRLNEINGCCEKILPVSGLFWGNLNVFRMMDFTAWLHCEDEMWGWMESYHYFPWAR